MAALLDLPLEVAGFICEYLSRPDLRSVRESIRRFEPAAARVLYQTINLKINLDSFDRAKKIAEHDAYRQYVESIYYDGRELSLGHANKGFFNWVRFDAARGFNVSGVIRHKIVDSFSEAQLQNGYFNYCRYLFGQERIFTYSTNHKTSKRLKVSGSLVENRSRAVKYATICYGDREND